MIMFYRIFPIVILILLTSYSVYKLYKNYWTFLFTPLVMLLPFYLFNLYRFNRNTNLEYILGQYLFFLNNIVLIFLFILFTNFILKFFSVNIYSEISKRQSFFHLFLISIFIGLYFVGQNNFESISVNRKVFKLEKTTTHQNFKIGFISDIHLSGEFDGGKLRKAFKIMKDEGVEMVLIGGDFLDNSHRLVKDDIKGIVSNNVFKHGIHLVLGNHEYYGGIKANMNYIQKLGINILKDESLEVNGITIVGRDDRYNKNRKSLSKLLKTVDSKKPIIIIDHNPKSLDELKNEKVDLYLSGHTHKGQLFPFNLIVN
ncbi:MAG: metallophosphoesterase, partial [Cetobacterium sp.]